MEIHTQPQSNSGRAEPPPLVSDADSHVFRFVFEGSPQPLKSFLVARYGASRGPDWAEDFYPDRVRLNGRAVARETVVHPGAEISYLHLRNEEPAPPHLAEPLFEDDWLVVLQKPDCIPVSPAGIYYFTSMAILARERLGNRELTPAHRLDLETSGPVIFARRKADLKEIHRLFEGRSIRKRYRALVHGAFPAELRTISGRIVPHPASAIATKLALQPGPGGSAGSLTRVISVVHRGPFSELELEPVTGKTNQLRVHLAAVGHPIVGDKKYHDDEGVFLDWYAHRDFGRLRRKLLLPRQALAAERLEFTHPVTGEPVRVEAPAGSWEEKLQGLTP